MMKKINLLVVLVVSTLLMSCSMNTHLAQRDLETTMKQEGEHIYCSGYKTWKDCYQSAKKVCSNGYNVISFDETLYSQRRVMRVICK